MEWTAGEILKAGKQNVINAPLVDQKNVVFPQLQNQTWFNKGYNRDGVLIKDGDSFFTFVIPTQALVMKR